MSPVQVIQLPARFANQNPIIQGGHQLGPTHSHSFEAMFLQIPGLLVACPSTAADGKALLKAAIRDDNPVVFIEHETLYGMRGEVPEDDDHVIDFGIAAVRREGADATIRQLRAMLHLGGPPRNGWNPPILPVVALREDGVAELATAIEQHITHLRESGHFTAQQRQRAAHEFKLIVQEAALERAHARIAGAAWEALIDRIARREIDPYTAAEELLE